MSAIGGLADSRAATRRTYLCGAGTSRNFSAQTLAGKTRRGKHWGKQIGDLAKRPINGAAKTQVYMLNLHRQGGAGRPRRCSRKARRESGSRTRRHPNGYTEMARRSRAVEVCA